MSYVKFRGEIYPSIIRINPNGPSKSLCLYLSPEYLQEIYSEEDRVEGQNKPVKITLTEEEDSVVIQEGYRVDAYLTILGSLQIILSSLEKGIIDIGEIKDIDPVCFGYYPMEEFRFEGINIEEWRNSHSKK